MGCLHGFSRSFITALPLAAAVTAGLPASQPVGAQGPWSAGWCGSEFQDKFMKTQVIKYNSNLVFGNVVGYSWYSLRHYGIHSGAHVICGSTTNIGRPDFTFMFSVCIPLFFEMTLVFFVTTLNFFPGCFEFIMLPSVKAVEFIQSPSSWAGSTYLWDIFRW